MPSKTAIRQPDAEGLLKWTTAPRRASRALAPIVAIAAIAFLAPQAPAAVTSTIQSNFNGTAIPGGDTIWFNSVFTLNGAAPTAPLTIFVRNSTIQISGKGVNETLSVPNAAVTFDPAATKASTSFDPASNTWKTTLPTTSLSGNAFLDGFGFQVPAAGLPGGIGSVTWTGDFSATQPLGLSWKWGAAVYTDVSADTNALGVKPVDDNSASVYLNADHAGTPENFKNFVVGGARGGGGSNFTGSYSGTASVQIRAVPEPSSLALAIIAGGTVIAVAGRRRIRVRNVA